MDDNITQAEQEEFRAMRNLKPFKRLTAYMEARADNALTEACLAAEHGEALKCVANVRVHHAFRGALDDFSSTYQR